MSLWFKVQLWSFIWRDCPEEFMWGYKTLYDLKLLLQSGSTKTIVFLVLRPLVSSLIEWKTHSVLWRTHRPARVWWRVNSDSALCCTVHSIWLDGQLLAVDNTHTHTHRAKRSKINSVLNFLLCVYGCYCRQSHLAFVLTCDWSASEITHK